MGLSATGYYRLYVGYEVGSTWYPMSPAVTTTIAVGMPGAASWWCAPRCDRITARIAGGWGATDMPARCASYATRDLACHVPYAGAIQVSSVTNVADSMKLSVTFTQGLQSEPPAKPMR